MDLEAGVALVVLARDEEPFLEDCYRHHAPYFDFTICLVSRSNDRTEAIAKRNFDCVEVISFPGSFGLFREHANNISPYRWVLHVDADERFPITLLLHIRNLAERLPPGTTLGFPRINPPSYPAPWPDYQYRLMGKETRYVGRVHERPLGGKRQLPAITENAIIHLAPVARIQAKISRWRSLGDQYWAGVFENTNRYTNMKKYSPDKLEIREGTSDRAVVEEVIHRRTYLKDFILPFIKHNGLIIDIGAHIGSFTIQACSLLHPKVVLAIEPERDNFSHLIKNVTKARFKKIVHPIQVALWNSPAKKELYCQLANRSTHSLLPSWRERMTNPFRLETKADAYEIQPVQTDTLDKVLKSFQLEHAKIELIKIDVEGAEKQVLEGSLEALRRCNVMIGELHEAILSEDELRKQLVDFVVAIGEPCTPLRVRTFWAVRTTRLRNKTALREFRRAAKVASLQDTIWKLERETMSQNALAASMMDSLTNQLNLTHSSVSWRISAPVRWIGSILVRKPKFQAKLENKQIAHVQSGPLGALQNPRVRGIFRQIIEERLNNNLLSSYYRLGERVDSYDIQSHRVSREELAGKIIDFLTILPKNDPIDAARAFWSEFSFSEGNNAGVPIEVNSIESAYGRICQMATGVVMIQDLLTQPNLPNGRIVDVGCLSNEFNMAILSQADHNGIRIQKAIGTDIVETTMALNDPRLAFRKQPSPKRLPLESEFADLAILKWTLHHMTLDEVTSITREINRILKPGGKAVLIEALVGVDRELHRGFLAECRQKDSWPEGPWQKVRRNITKRYFQLSLDEQKAVLALEDYYGHWLESMRTSMPLPFTYLTRDEIGHHFEVTGMNESAQLRRVFGFAPIIHQGPPSIRLVYEKRSTR